MSVEYYTIQLTRDELDEVSLALKTRINDLTNKLTKTNSPEGRKLMLDLLMNCKSAQEEIQGRTCPQKYEVLLYPEEGR